MASHMKTVSAPRTNDAVLVVTIHPLSVARGHRPMKRGGVHQTARQPSRAQVRRALRRELVAE